MSGATPRGAWRGCAAWLLAVGLAWAPSLSASVDRPAGAAAPAAGDAVRMVDEPALDRRTRAIAQTLRCLVCQGESVADSQASLAADMRAEIRAKLAQGWDEPRIRAYFIARYGDFVLYRPPLKASTLVLWFAPVTGVVLGMAGMLLFVRRRSRGETRPLTRAESARAQAYLEDPREHAP